MRHLVIGNVGIGFISKPHGNQLVRVGLEKTGQSLHLFALGPALTMLKSAVSGHIHADGFGEILLELSAL